MVLDALWMASIAANEVSVVECHGTGTPLGDPIEVRALRVLQRPEQLYLGAGKTNLGHLEVVHVRVRRLKSSKMHQSDYDFV